MKELPRLLFTMGDVAGIGPEIIARAWPQLCGVCRPTVVGDRVWLERALHLVGSPAQVRPPSECTASKDVVPFCKGSDQDLSGVASGHVSAAAGRSAYDFLCKAI